MGCTGSRTSATWATSTTSARSRGSLCGTARTHPRGSCPLVRCARSLSLRIEANCPRGSTRNCDPGRRPSPSRSRPSYGWCMAVTGSSSRRRSTTLRGTTGSGSCSRSAMLPVRFAPKASSRSFSVQSARTSPGRNGASHPTRRSRLRCEIERHPPDPGAGGSARIRRRAVLRGPFTAARPVGPTSHDRANPGVPVRSLSAGRAGRTRDVGGASAVGRGEAGDPCLVRRPLPGGGGAGRRADPTHPGPALTQGQFIAYTADRHEPAPGLGCPQARSQAAFKTSRHHAARDVRRLRALLTDRRRRYCDACRKRRFIELGASARERGFSILAQLREEGSDPAHGGRAAEIRGRNNRAHQGQSTPGRASGPTRRSFAWRSCRVLRRKPIGELVAATGLSEHYCSLIRRGKKIPHPRHWEALRMVGDLASVRRFSAYLAR